MKDPRTEDLGLEYYEKAKLSSQYQPQKTTLKSLLRYLVKSKKWDLISVISRDIKMYQVLPDKVFCAEIVSTCIKNRKFKIVDLFLDSLEIDKEIVGFGYESALRSYNKLHIYSLTIDLYEKMKLNDVVLDLDGYVLVMEAYKKVGRYKKVLEIFSELEGSIKQEDTEASSRVYGVLLEALGKLGQSEKAIEQFKQMGEKGIPLMHQFTLW